MPIFGQKINYGGYYPIKRKIKGGLYKTLIKCAENIIHIRWLLTSFVFSIIHISTNLRIKAWAWSLLYY